MSEPQFEGFRELVESCPYFVWVFDGVQVLYANAAARALPGGEAPTAPAQSLHPDDLVDGQERSRRVLAGESLGPRDYRFVLPDGRRPVVECSSVRVTWNKAHAIATFGRDVTEARGDESRLMHTDRLASLGTLLASAAHDVASPLAYGQMLLEHVLAGGTAVNGPSLKDDLEDVLGALRRALGSVRQLQSFARDVPAAKVPVQLAVVVERAKRLVASLLRHSGQLEVNVEPVPEVLGDELRLEQLLVNLLVNAVHALPEGRRENRVALSLRPAVRGVELVVEDNGVGIEPSVFPRIFDPFFTTKDARKGTGLGLYIAQRSIREMGGRISAESEAGCGTKFTVWLPALGQGETK